MSGAKRTEQSGSAQRPLDIPEGLAVPLLIPLGNDDCIDRDAVPLLELEDLHGAIVQGTARGMRLSALFGVPDELNGVCLYAVLADDRAGALRIARAARRE